MSNYQRATQSSTAKANDSSHRATSGANGLATGRKTSTMANGQSRPASTVAASTKSFMRQTQSSQARAKNAKSQEKRRNDSTYPMEIVEWEK
ncbi:hypothetical protein EV356DRAFT_536101 [Viridothelium virens]|uniref:Uncharacterized protein n=1 Tax=Viridothelium virens TaxID=1048519 RepID=A0A6A6GYN6_VIRVR|nr:hypothetical protein EV356DRAFT_536101 [Viridothelium virens]